MLMWLKLQIYPTESGNTSYLASTTTSASGNVNPLCCCVCITRRLWDAEH